MACNRDSRGNSSCVHHGFAGLIWHDADDQSFCWGDSARFSQRYCDNPVGECDLCRGAGGRRFVDGYRVQQAEDVAAGDQPERSSQ